MYPQALRTNRRILLTAEMIAAGLAASCGGGGGSAGSGYQSKGAGTGFPAGPGLSFGDGINGGLGGGGQRQRGRAIDAPVHLRIGQNCEMTLYRSSRWRADLPGNPNPAMDAPECTPPTP
jgi:hypothetical protein